MLDRWFEGAKIGVSGAVRDRWKMGECKFETGWAPLFHVSAAGRAAQEGRRGRRAKGMMDVATVGEEVARKTSRVWCNSIS
jgi:hypothetical protein